jgi:hypothetical protein
VLLQASHCCATFDGPVTAPASILPSFPSRGVSSVVISSRRGPSLPGRVVGGQVWSPAGAPPPRAGRPQGAPRGGHRRPDLISEAVPGPGGAQDACAVLGPQ